MRGKILVVDDSADLRYEFRLWFEAYDVAEAASAEEALAILKKPNEIDVIIMDVQMSGMDGLTALARVKELAPDKSVIIMTGFSTKESAIRALKGRADGYIEKPFDIREMREAIERELSKKAGEADPAEMDLDAKVLHVKRFIESNRFRKVTLADAAATVFLTPKYLSKVFREKAGMGFSDYKLKVKMEQARKMLESSGRSVKQISAKLGYATPESFIRQFEKIVHSTPSGYRRSYR